MRFPRRVFAALCILSATPLAACSLSEGTDSAKAEVKTFHARFNAEDWETVYAQSHEEFREATDKKEFMEFMKVVREKLGKHTGGESTGWRANSTNGTTTVALSFTSNFAEGEGTENFVFVIENKKARLLNYKIDSKTLIMK